MKNILLIYLILIQATSISLAQSIWTDSVKVRRSSSSNSYNYHENSWRNSSYLSRGGYYNDYISLDNIDKRINILAKDIKQSPQYGERKRKHLLKDLEYARIKFKQADINRDGVLSEHEQQLYKEDVFID